MKIPEGLKESMKAMEILQSNTNSEVPKELEESLKAMKILQSNAKLTLMPVN